jgi:tetratricopeptide (TPR) repeat protein
MVKKKDKAEDRIEAVEQALSKSEQFIERNQKIITYLVGGLILVVLLFFGYRKYIHQPREIAALKALFRAEYYFEQDSLHLALFGDGESYGFIDVIDDYGSTKAGNLARYYAGVCYMDQGDYENALRHFRKFKSRDVIVSAMAYGAMGDAYMQLGEFRKAADYYLKAATRNKNDFTSPPFLLKAGWAYEARNSYRDALKVYEQLRTQFPKSREARDIDRYIARAKAELGEL